MAAQPDDAERNEGRAAKAADSSNGKAKASPENPELEEEEEDADEEPKLKYVRLTSSLGSVYRNGDATSSFAVAGDRMVIGTHNGSIHVLAIPSLQTLRNYRAHSASITAVSVSPFPLPFSPTAAFQRSQEAPSTPVKSPSGGSTIASPRTPKQAPLPATPSNSIYIATSSIDGNVCVSSLVDPNDVTLRNFARPVQAVALSPEYKSDRSYLSGGLAGNLILTSGGRVGVSSNANTNSAAAAASGWLGSIGLGSNTGKDAILHSGEGSISTIQWSLSGKYVAWVNEKGIKIMRSSIALESADADSAWKRIGHVDSPSHGQWEEMAGSWKARLAWIDNKNLEADDEEISAAITSTTQSSQLTEPNNDEKSHPNGHSKRKKKRIEKLVAGWGDTAWVLHVHPGGAGVGKEVGERSVGKADIVHKLRFDDCLVSGITLYTPSLLLVLAYRIRDDNDQPIPMTVHNTPKRGVHHRQNGLQPELRLIHVETKEEVEVDTLTVSRFESLSAGDYHVGTVYVPPIQAIGPSQRGALEAISGLWDASVSATRIFSSGASTVSGRSAENGIASPSLRSAGRTSDAGAKSPLGHPAAATVGLKIFIQSPYDCVLTVKRDLSDRLSWYLDNEQYKEAWELMDRHPEVFAAAPEEGSVASPVTPSRTQDSLRGFLADDTSETTISEKTPQFSAVEKEKRRLGDLWVQQLVQNGGWASAGKVAGQVLGTSARWEHWVWTFAQANRFDEIAPYIPSKPLKPPLPSMVYEVVLGHYIAHDRLRLRELLEQWDPDLFDIGSVTAAIESKLQSGDVREDSIDDGQRGRDWRILLDSLATLYLADARPKEALRCYIRLQNADAAMELIRDYQLVGAISDDVPGFVLLRVPAEQLDLSTDRSETMLHDLEESSAEAIRLLVDEAYKGVVRPEVVVDQLSRKGPSLQPFLFFYLRSLWKGLGTESLSGKARQRIAAEGRELVEQFGDLAVELFAEYDRPLLMEFLRSSQSYIYEKACSICESRKYIPELVYLLSKTGQTKRALKLIISELDDVSMAISFAKEQDDPDLWNDLLDYSMDKPRFIRGLLEEVGTSINPITLVRRIPEGLEIEGLREGIHRMVREYEIQFSISEGVAKVLRSEVAEGMEELRRGRRRAVRFDIAGVLQEKDDLVGEDGVTPVEAGKQEEHPDAAPRPGHCVKCRDTLTNDESAILIGFPCRHIYHLTCLLDAIPKDGTNSAAVSAVERLQDQLAIEVAQGLTSSTRSVGAKVAHAHVIRRALGGNCPVCVILRAQEDEGWG